MATACLQTLPHTDNGGRIESDYRLATDTAVVGVRVFCDVLFLWV